MYNPCCNTLNFLLKKKAYPLFIVLNFLDNNIDSQAAHFVLKTELNARTKGASRRNFGVLP